MRRQGTFFRPSAVVVLEKIRADKFCVYVIKEILRDSILWFVFCCSALSFCALSLTKAYVCIKQCVTVILLCGGQ